MYLIESHILKDEVGFLIFVESLQTLFYGLTRGLSNFFDTASLITSSSTYGVKSIGLPVIGSSLVHIDTKEILNM